MIDIQLQVNGGLATGVIHSPLVDYVVCDFKND